MSRLDFDLTRTLFEMDSTISFSDFIPIALTELYEEKIEYFTNENQMALFGVRFLLKTQLNSHGETHVQKQNLKPLSRTKTFHDTSYSGKTLISTMVQMSLRWLIADVKMAVLSEVELFLT